jgi:hypothetical protein
MGHLVYATTHIRFERLGEAAVPQLLDGLVRQVGRRRLRERYIHHIIMNPSLVAPQHAS